MSHKRIFRLTSLGGSGHGCVRGVIYSLLHHALAVRGKLKFSCTLIEASFSSLPPMKFLLEDLAILFISTSQ